MNYLASLNLLKKFDLCTQAEKTPEMFCGALETRISITTADAIETPHVFQVKEKLECSSNACHSLLT